MHPTTGTILWTRLRIVQQWGRRHALASFSSSSSNNNDNNNNNTSRGRRPKKDNFAHKVLDPAARGNLQKGHKSGIPRLIHRRPKGHGVKGADSSFGTEDEELELEQLLYDDDDEDDDERTTRGASSASSNKAARTGTIDQNSPPDELSAREYGVLQDFIKEYSMLVNSVDEEVYYWDERDYDNEKAAQKAALLNKLQAEATLNKEGNYVVDVDDETWAMFAESDKEDDEEQETQAAVDPQQERQRGPSSMMDSQDFQFVMETMGIKSTGPHSEEYDEVLPLQLKGGDIKDVVEAMMHHPTKFGEVRYEVPHEESTREPLPENQKNRINPDLEFVENHVRFLYVWGLPPLTVAGQPGDLENPLHCMELQKQVGALFDVPPEQVSVASVTSAFVGFTNIDDHRFASVVGPMEEVVASPSTIAKFEPSKDFDLAKDGADCLVLLGNLPPGFTTSILAESLFPAGSEVGDVYGVNLTPDRIVMLSPTTAVLRLESAEMADHALTSSLVQERLKEIGQHRVRYSKARRELIFTGKHGGPDGTDRLRALGRNLIVDGDMPTKKFFLSHSDTLLLRNLGPTVTKEDISMLFQPFCSVSRDVDGSVEFVTCAKGLPTGHAYVGFDEAGEAESARMALAKSGRIERGLLGETAVVVKKVREHGKKQGEQRPSRSEDGLLDSLHNWEQFVNPADLQVLYDHGINKAALDETMRTIRFQNPTFASLDQATRNETLNPETVASGMYAELVRTYVSTLKDCISTPDDPGPIYESLFLPGEKIDTEIFDRESARQEELNKKRQSP